MGNIPQKKQKEIMKLGSNLKNIRLLRGFEQAIAAEKAIMDTKTLRKAEKGEAYLNEDQLNRLAKLYNVHVNFLRHFDFEHYLAIAQKVYFLQLAHNYSNEEVLQRIKLSLPKN